MSRGPVRFLLLVLVATVAGAASAGADGEAAWRALAEGGHVALIRHATAPGIGDPPGFRLDDCATQRNLSASGRAEAERIGDAFRARGIAVEAVYSSRWCRCLETAERLGLGPVTPWPALDSFFERPERRGAQTAELTARLAADPPSAARVLVTHQVNIGALTAVDARAGEIVVVRPGTGGVEVVGRIPPP
jgi:phosphohistidine phosphatase SixA